MPKIRLPYPADFLRQMSELARAGRAPAELVRGFECTAQTISNWAA
jgi:transposase